MRNGIPVRAQGDKDYGSPEYSTGFFNESGLIPGSTNAEHHSGAKRLVGISEFQTI